MIYGAILGPVPCRGCGQPVTWFRLLSRAGWYDDVRLTRFASWVLHRCQGGR